LRRIIFLNLAAHRMFHFICMFGKPVSEQAVFPALEIIASQMADQGSG